MQHRFRTAVSRIASILGLVIVSSALIAPLQMPQSASELPSKRWHLQPPPPPKTADRRVAVTLRSSDRQVNDRRRVSAKAGVRPVKASAVSRAPVVPAKLSFGQMAGLHEVSDPWI